MNGSRYEMPNYSEQMLHFTILVISFEITTLLGGE